MTSVKNNPAPICKTPEPQETCNEKISSCPKKESKPVPKKINEKSSHDHSNKRREKAKQSISGQTKKSRLHASTSYLKPKVQYHNGKDGKNGLDASITGAEGKFSYGHKNNKVQVNGKILQAEAVTLVNTKKRSYKGALGTTLIEGGIKARKGNVGIGVTGGVGLGASGRVALCDDVNKDGKKEINIQLAGALGLKGGIDIRLPNVLAKYTCPDESKNKPKATK